MIPNPSDYAMGCEGSGGPGNRDGVLLRCQMCNRTYVTFGVVPDHRRLDIIAMIDDGAIAKMSHQDALAFMDRAREMGLC